MKNNHYLKGWGIAMLLLLFFSSLFSQFSYECPPDISQYQEEKSIQLISGTIEEGTTTEFSIEDCLNTSISDGFYWTTIPITVESTDRYIFEIDGLVESGIIAIYQNDFSATNYCDNLLATGRFLNAAEGYDSFSQMPTQEVSVLLSEGQNYTLLIANTVGDIDFQIAGYSKNGGSLSSFASLDGVILNDLITASLDAYGINNTLSYQWDSEGQTITGSISDVEKYQRALRGGLPILVSDCDNNMVTMMTEYVENGDCGDFILVQHYNITEDNEGSCNFNSPETAECQQNITFRIPHLYDITLPNKIVSLIGTNGSYPLDEEYRPHPSHTGYPFFDNLETSYLLAETANNMAANYNDDTSIPGIVLRHWSIQNWCAPGEFINFFQTILVDFVAGMEVDCPDDISQINIESFIQIEEYPALSTNQILNSTDANCLSNEQGDFYYKTYTFSASQAGQYVFEISGLSENGLVAIYQNEPSVGTYCDHLLATGKPLSMDLGYTNFDAISSTSRIVPYLSTGQNYTLLMADNVINNNMLQVAVYPLDGGTINEFSGTTGTIINDITIGYLDDFFTQDILSYQWDNDGETIPESISDIESYQSMFLTGLPTLYSDCNINSVEILDVLTADGDCGDAVIVRHYEIQEDSEGNCNFNIPQHATCDQTITFRQFSLSDVCLPNQIVDLGCSAYLLDDDGHPNPILTGFPFILNGKDKYDLAENGFTLAANYTDDTSTPGRIIREWQVIDWCAPGDMIFFYQTLIIDTDNNIDLDCPDNTDQVTVSFSVQELSATVVVNENEIDFTDAPCLSLTFHDEYATQTTAITVDVTDLYTFEIEGLTTDDFAAIYRSAIDIDNPCADIIAVSQSSPNHTGFFSGSSAANRFSAILTAGQTYHLLTAALNNTTASWAVYSENGGQLTGIQNEVAPITFDLMHWDVSQLAIITPQTYLVNNLGEVEAPTLSDELKNILDMTGYPLITSLQGNVQVTVSDEIIFNEDCDDIIIHRLFTVEEVIITDHCNDNPTTHSCQQIITFRQEEIKDIFWPVITTTLNCNDFFETNEDGFPSVNETGFPFLTSAFSQVEINDVYSGNILNQHTLYDITDNSVRRQWAVVNECSFSDNGFFNQYVSINQQMPILECLPANHDSGIFHYNLTSGDCTVADIEIPMPAFPNQCASFANIDIEVSHVLADGTEEIIATFLNAQNPTIENLVEGFYYFKYTATNEAGEVSSLDCPFIVQDNTTPIPICDQDLHISIGGSGYARVYHADIDEGSYDNCGDHTFEVRRDGVNTWSEYVDFDCADVNQEVGVYLRVWDDANANGIFGDTIQVTYPNGHTEMYADNFSICSIIVLIEDKINPYCFAPNNDSFLCNDEVLENVDYYDVNQMNELFGTPTATDNCEATSQQISINVNIDDCGYGTIVRTFRSIDTWGLPSLNGCQQVVTIHKIHDYNIRFPRDETISCGGEPENIVQFENNGCSEFSYDYEDELGGMSNEGCRIVERTYSVINTCLYDGVSPAVIIGRDEDEDANPGDEDIYLIAQTVFNGSNPITTTYLDRDDYLNNGYWTNSDVNPALGAVGFYQYTQFLYLSGGDAPTIDYPDAGDIICLDGDPCDLSGLPYFVVHPICPMELIDIHVYFDENNDGSIETEAVIFELDVNENGDIEVVFIPTITETGTYNITVSATDVCGSEGIFSFVTTVENCDDFHLGGEITTTNELAMENVAVFIINPTDTSVLYTNEEGVYQSCNISENASFTVQPYLNSNLSQGVTTADLINLQKHILGIELITDPYALIAADIDNSTALTSMDMILLVKIILGSISEIPSNTSWRFVDKSYQFTSNNPLDEGFPESIYFEDYTSEVFNVDFIGVKIGDINGSAVFFQDEDLDERGMEEVVFLETNNSTFKKGDYISVAIKLGKNQATEGIQGTLGFDEEALTFIETENYAITTTKGMIPFVWTIFDKEAEVLNLSFYTKKAGNLSDFITLNSRLIAAFSIDKSSLTHSIALTFIEEEEESNTLKLSQNYPNPFSKSTVISFELEEEGTVDVLIQNLQGIIIKTIPVKGITGENSISLSGSDFPAAGIYFYTLVTKEKRVTKKMIFNR